MGPYDIEPVPETSWGKSLAHLARAPNSGFQGQWEAIRKRELARAKDACEYCGIHQDKGLICHEEWSYDEVTHRQTLVGFKISCNGCNLILHPGRTNMIGRQKEAIDQFTRTTGLPEQRLAEAVRKAFSDWERRSQYGWIVDVSWEPLANGFQEKLNLLS